MVGSSFPSSPRMALTYRATALQMDRQALKFMQVGFSIRPWAHSALDRLYRNPAAPCDRCGAAQLCVNRDSPCRPFSPRHHTGRAGAGGKGMFKPDMLVTRGFLLLLQAAWPAQPPPLPKHGTTGTTTGAAAASSEPRMSAADRTAPKTQGVQLWLEAVLKAVELELPGEVPMICSSSSRRPPLPSPRFNGG